LSEKAVAIGYGVERLYTIIIIINNSVSLAIKPFTLHEYTEVKQVTTLSFIHRLEAYYIFY